MSRIQLWGDGAVKGNGKPEAIAGWGVCIVVNDTLVREFNGHLPAKKLPPFQSNNTGELTAIVEGLKQFQDSYEIDVYSDSQYVILGMTKWRHGWDKTGWKNTNGEPVKNKKIWKELIELAEKHDIKWVHVKGHAGVEFNERCDILAKRGVLKDLVDNVYEPMTLCLQDIPIYTPMVYEFAEDDDMDY